MFDKEAYWKNRAEKPVTVMVHKEPVTVMRRDRGQGPRVRKTLYFSRIRSSEYLDDKVVTDKHGQFISAKRHPLEYWARRLELLKEMDDRKKPRQSMKDALKAGDVKA